MVPTGEPPQQEAIKEDWVEVQRKKKVLKNETKVYFVLHNNYCIGYACVLFRIVISMCIYIALSLSLSLSLVWCTLPTYFLQSGTTNSDGLNENDELDFEFDDDLQLGGKVHSFSDQPW